MKFSSQFITALCRFGQYSRLLLNKPMRVFWYFIIICALCFCIKCGAFFHGYAIMNPDDKAGLKRKYSKLGFRTVQRFTVLQWDFQRAVLFFVRLWLWELTMLFLLPTEY